MDNVQFSKNCWTNRVKIAGNGDPIWLTVPAIRPDGLRTLIRNVEIDGSQDWVRTQRRTLEARYGRCEHFKIVYPRLAEILESRPVKLAELNLRIIHWILETLSVKVPVIVGSSLNVSGAASELIVAMCKSVGATQYVAGQGSDGYEDETVYERAGVSYRRDNFQHESYAQEGHDLHIPGLSIFDALVNLGVEGTRQLLVAPSHQAP